MKFLSKLENDLWHIFSRTCKLSYKFRNFFSPRVNNKFKEMASGQVAANNKKKKKNDNSVPESFKILIRL